MVYLQETNSLGIWWRKESEYLFIVRIEVMDHYLHNLDF